MSQQEQVVSPPARALDALRTPSNRFAMLALDQRESLRAMFDNSESGASGTDDDLVAFKLLATRALTHSASGVLLDRLFALDSDSLAAIDPNCGLIVAADTLVQELGQPVSSTLIDDYVTVDFLHSIGASAVKFLVMWREKSGADDRQRMINSILQLCDKAGVASLVEAVVLPDEGLHWTDIAEKNDAIMKAAGEMSHFPIDLYKAQVPGYIPGDLSRVRQAAAELGSIVGTEWVVLSNGINREDFEGAVRESLRGGASGFLAGRAIWADLVGARDSEAVLEGVALPRLKNLYELVESFDVSAPTDG